MHYGSGICEPSQHLHSIANGRQTASVREQHQEPRGEANGDSVALPRQVPLQADHDRFSSQMFRLRPQVRPPGLAMLTQNDHGRPEKGRRRTATRDNGTVNGATALPTGRKETPLRTGVGPPAT
jgi:hypothetical protein